MHAKQHDATRCLLLRVKSECFAHCRRVRLRAKHGRAGRVIRAHPRRAAQAPKHKLCDPAQRCSTIAGSTNATVPR